MPYITKQFTYDIPDKWQEQETTLGKTSTQTYTGPDKVISFVQNGRIVSTHNKDKDDGRPCPADWEPVEIDCEQMPLHCGILWGGLVPPTHYEVEVGPADRLNPTIADPTHPSEVFDIVSITDGYDTNTKTWGAVRFASPLPEGEPGNPSMDDIRRARNGLLENCDQKISEDMPADLKQKWLDYRQKLRDIPADYPTNSDTEKIMPQLVVFPPAPGPGDGEVNMNTEMGLFSAVNPLQTDVDNEGNEEKDGGLEHHDDMGDGTEAGGGKWPWQGDKTTRSEVDGGDGIVKIADQTRTDWQSQMPKGIASDD